MNTETWLRELGAVRPMAPAGASILVLGEWIEGHYPIEWRRRHTRDRTWDTTAQKRIIMPPRDEWRLFGVPCEPLDREACERIMWSIAIQEKGA